MTKMKRSIGLTTLFCSALCSVVRAADFRPLDVKTGQWENTLSGQTTGLPPIPEEVLSKMTPEQRARMEAVMQSRSGQGQKATAAKSCLTKDKLDKAFAVGDESIKSCTRTLSSSSGSEQEIRIECNREGMKSTGTVKVKAVDSENVKGSMQMTVAHGDHTMNMNYTFAARWIGPVCTESK